MSVLLAWPCVSFRSGYFSNHPPIDALPQQPLPRLDPTAKASPGLQVASLCFQIGLLASTPRPCLPTRTPCVSTVFLACFVYLLVIASLW